MVTKRASAYPYFTKETVNSSTLVERQHGRVRKAYLNYFAGNDHYMFYLKVRYTISYANYELFITNSKDDREIVESMKDTHYLDDQIVFDWCNQMIEKNYPRANLIKEAIRHISDDILAQHVQIEELNKELEKIS